MERVGLMGSILSDWRLLSALFSQSLTTLLSSGSASISLSTQLGQINFSQFCGERNCLPRAAPLFQTED
jgi:hypothetical protein